MAITLAIACLRRLAAAADVPLAGMVLGPSALFKELFWGRHNQGRLLCRMASLGFPLRDEAWLQTLTQDLVKTSAIEGEQLPVDSVRSSIARRQGVDIKELASMDRHVEGVVDMMLDATWRCL